MLFLPIQLSLASITKKAVPGEVVIKLTNPQSSMTFLKDKHLQEQVEIIDQANGLLWFKNDSYKKSQIPKSEVIWQQQVYEILGNAQEVIPNDPRFNEQAHHQIISTLDAWRFSEGSEEVIVAVTDNGFEIEHDDLKQSWWVNTAEIPGNGIDDDGNGFIDDVHGWNFDKDNNDVTPSSSNSHGTHVAGIIAAQAHNGLGIAGIAPKVKVMPINFYGDNRWTSITVYKSYKYAVDNGAKIINTSYNIDGFVNDQIYLEALEYVKNKGALIFNSAGNDRRKDPPRRAFNDLILVCSTQSKPGQSSQFDQISRFSNYGAGISLCAPGDPILSTVNGRYLGDSRYGNLSGTSMASPVAASVAALIWSQNPDYTADEVKEKLLRSCDSIDRINPRHQGMLGAGRINARKALTR